MCFHLIKVAECQPFYIYFLGFPLSILFMMPCLQKTFPRKQRFVFFQMFTSEVLFTFIPSSENNSTNITVKRSIFLTDYAFEGSIFKPEAFGRLSPSGSQTTTFLADFEKNRLSKLIFLFSHNLLS